MRTLIPLRASTGGHWLTPVVAVLVLAAGVGWAWRWTGGPASAGDPVSTWTWVPLLSFGMACAVAGLLWGRQQAISRLREARLGEQHMLQLVDAWVWRSNADHGITSWRPPPHAPTSAWARASENGVRLWERFELIAGGQGDAGALRARLDSQALLTHLRVRRVDDASGAAWRLQAVPRFDDHGRFAGYVGSATPLEDEEQCRFDQSVLRQLWPELGTAAVVLRAGRSGWQVAALSDDAARLLRVDASSGPGLDWARLCRSLPDYLADSLVHPAPGPARDVGDWSLRLTAIDAGQLAAPGLLLLLRPRLAVSEEHSVSASDHESFTYSISHDLRAPIRVVEGFTRILKEDYGRFLDRIGNDHLDRVLAAAARMNSMIDALLALSRLQSQPLQRKPVDLSQLAHFIIEDLRRESPERSAEITIESGVVVQGDPTLLRIAMDNLLGNAWKYSGQCPLTRIDFRTERRDDHTVLVVADQGAGFDMRFADRLFGVFQRLHSPKDFQGTGVGLASVRRILRRHGGDIWAEAEVGKGARFYFNLA